MSLSASPPAPPIPPPVRFPLFSKLSPCCRWSPFFSNVSSRVTGCQHACQGRLVQGGIVSLALLPSGFTLKCHFCPLQLSQLPPAVQGGPPGARQPHHPRLKPQLDGGKHRWRHLCNVVEGEGRPVGIFYAVNMIRLCAHDDR